MEDQATTRLEATRPNCSELLRNQIRSVSDPLKASANWMKFLAVLSILGAVISIIGTLAAIVTVWWALAFAVLPLWYGIILYAAGNASQKAAYSGNESDLQTALQKLGLYFKIAGIVALISLIVSTLSLCTAMPGMLR